MSLLALTLLACGPDQWTTAADCEAISAGSRQDECWATVAPDLFRQDPVGAEQIVTTKVSDSRVRDYIWLTVTREVDPGSYKYCDKIKEEALGERCRVLVSRPHLHRELLKGGEEGSTLPPGATLPGGAPPGGAPPGGAPPGGAPPGGAPPGGAPPTPTGAPTPPGGG